MTKLNYHSVNQSSFVSWHTEVKGEQTEAALFGKCCDLMFFHSSLIVQQIFVECSHSLGEIMFKVFNHLLKVVCLFQFRWIVKTDNRTDGRDRWDDNNRFEAMR